MASEIDGPAEAAVVFATRAKALTHDLLAQAAAAVGAGGPIIVDGAKADGIDSLLKRLRGITQVGEVFSKAHGKCFQITAPQTLPDDWRALPRDVDGFRTAPGVFSADGVDPGSALLVAHLDALSGRVCDLGAGWGYLSSHILAQSAVTEVTLVEAEALALDCARVNVADPRARFHWADATRWEGGPYDAVVMNPPFHTGRKADPALGRSFVQVASRLLTPRGRLIMVANRHLPYEATLAESFGDTMVRADQGGYKVIEATRPKRRPT
ncbi:MFS transporter [Jannaschia pagri]|uniref:MFS transporter n=2 Tax=Roseobacteraceae TaxID=2854170 RepID=A0ABQ4NKH8_9RHOB|nr:MFS transporter [Jannaschia sp. AI_61]GIT94740.1 MFS transporter [Jannaschia sp. AI_62]